MNGCLRCLYPFLTPQPGWPIAGFLSVKPQIYVLAYMANQNYELQCTGKIQFFMPLLQLTLVTLSKIIKLHV